MASKDTNIAEHGRHDRLIKEHVHDPYMTREKLPEPTVCPECKAVFTEGRWQWSTTATPDANEHLCPACQRIRDRVPAGYLTLSGEFFREHRDEIMNLLENKVENQKTEHPLKRMMAVEDEDDGVVVTFTDTHLPRGVGEAIESAYEGDLDIQYTDESSIVRVYWQR